MKVGSCAVSERPHSATVTRVKVKIGGCTPMMDVFLTIKKVPDYALDDGYYEQTTYCCLIKTGNMPRKSLQERRISGKLRSQEENCQ